MALTGTATAASLITGKQIKDSTITTKDIKNRTIGTADISNSARNQLTGVQGAQGAPGAPGQQGPQGPSGQAVTTTNYVTGSLDPVGGANDIRIAEAPCPAGSQPVSGGYVLISGGGETWFSQRTRTGWAVGFANDSSVPADYEVDVYCTPGSSAVRAARTPDFERLIAARKAAK